MNPAVSAKIDDYFETQRERVDRELDQVLPGEDTDPASVHRAMRYSVFAAGKRLRPILCLESGNLLGAEERPLLRIAAALELIHTYSLIHDDLPAMDNDDFRRGKPTSHRVFGEAVAILAGDGLLTLAFEIIAAPGPIPAERQLRLTNDLAQAVGTRGMVGGQVVDLETTGSSTDPARLEFIHARKTGAFIRASVRAGALAAGSSESDLGRVSCYGEKMGLAFQIADDLLDVLGSRERMGKAVHKDGAHRKPTYPALYGIEESQRIARRLANQACEALTCYGGRADRLVQIADFLITRQF